MARRARQSSTSTSERPARPDDVAAITAVTREGFESYRSFAPAGWEPPDVSAEEGRLRERIAAEETWTWVAEDEGEIVAVVGFIPAPERPLLVTPAEGSAHVWAVFVRRTHWGTGLAKRLLDRAVEEMRRQGYARGRLVTPAGQERALAFYRREGWRELNPHFEPLFALDLVEFVLDLQLSA